MMEKVIKFEEDMKKAFRIYIKQLEDEKTRKFVEIAGIQTNIAKAKEELAEL